MSVNAERLAILAEKDRLAGENASLRRELETTKRRLRVATGLLRDEYRAKAEIGKFLDEVPT